MPRDGSNIYHTPPGTPGIPNTTIASSPYNGYLADIEQDLNTPRPIVAGGTGASDAATALFNLKAETAAQIVTNYDSQLWLPGSFQSAAGATSAPNNTSVFAGTCYIGEPLANPPTNQNVVITARDMSSALKPGPVYTRQKTAGVWSSWGTSGGGSDDASNRSAIYAAPFDALAYNGMQINGAISVSQEFNFASNVTTNNSSPCDGWRLFLAGTMGVVSGGSKTSLVSGIDTMLFLSVATAQASLSAGDYTMLQNTIEGYRMSRLGWGTVSAQPVTIGFWSQHARTGTYTVAVSNKTGSRSYCALYTHSVSNVSQYNVVTIPGCVDGVWEKENLTGLNVVFAVAAGSTYTAPSANVWASGYYFAVPGQVNAAAATTDNFRITGVVVLPGTEAPSAARSPLIMRPYDQELLTCQRYLRLPTPEGAGIGNATSAYFVVRHSGMRSSPTVIPKDTMAVQDIITTSYTQSSPNATVSGNNSEYGMYVLGNFTGIPAGKTVIINTAAGPNRFILDARL